MLINRETKKQTFYLAYIYAEEEYARGRTYIQLIYLQEGKMLLQDHIYN